MKTFSDVVQEYLNRGFGSMNKNDFEVYIFNYLLTTKYKEWNDYSISIDLALPLSKVKRLRYEASLKYPQLLTDYKKLFVGAMRGARYDEKIVVFSIENIALRQYLRNVLMKRGNFFDTSFNSDIIKVSNKDFLYLLEDICLSDTEKREIKHAITKNSDKDIPHLVTNAVSAIAKNVGGEALGNLTDLGMNALIDTIKTLFNN